jgi:hypothetical protein
MPRFDKRRRQEQRRARRRRQACCVPQSPADWALAVARRHLLRAFLIVRRPRGAERVLAPDGYCLLQDRRGGESIEVMAGHRHGGQQELNGYRQDRANPAKPARQSSTRRPRLAAASVRYHHRLGSVIAMAANIGPTG